MVVFLKPEGNLEISLAMRAAAHLGHLNDLSHEFLQGKGQIILPAC